ncbi:hypothetical protein C8J56DRAFT_350684 [Mycena floridula]|nr:hypothetical protein C8J56DRAFT_350684 [Mycena floridula]
MKRDPTWRIFLVLFSGSSVDPLYDNVDRGVRRAPTRQSESEVTKRLTGSPLSKRRRQQKDRVRAATCSALSNGTLQNSHTTMVLPAAGSKRFCLLFSGYKGNVIGLDGINMAGNEVKCWVQGWLLFSASCSRVVVAVKLVSDKRIDELPAASANVLTSLIVVV